MWGDQKCIFGLQTRGLREGEEREGEEEEEEEEEEGDQAKVWILAYMTWYDFCTRIPWV